MIDANLGNYIGMVTGILGFFAGIIGIVMGCAGYLKAKNIKSNDRRFELKKMTSREQVSHIQDFFFYSRTDRI